ncbi:MAG: ribonuclease P protein subunit [Candidatus Njordarchaeia archaeon]|nr:ribonuclease P protein subunit [Candidatus Korarchaeota archaeon]
MKFPREFFEPLIGKKVKIIKSTDESIEGVEGIIISETKNTFKIRKLSNNREIRVIKKICKFQIKIDEKRNIIVDGKLLENRYAKIRKMIRR